MTAWSLIASRLWRTALNLNLLLLFYRLAELLVFCSVFWFCVDSMPYRCSILNCKGNYDKENACTLYKLPANLNEQQRWTDAIPSFKQLGTSIKHFKICDKHWPPDRPMVTLRGGVLRPADPPSIFNVPKSCLPTPKLQPRPDEVEYVTKAYFDQIDLFNSYEQFLPKKKNFINNTGM